MVAHLTMVECVVIVIGMRTNEILLECEDRKCFNRFSHFHSNQCYIGCSQCFPVKYKNAFDSSPVNLLMTMAIIFAVIAVVCSLVGVVISFTSDNETYYSCSISDYGTPENCKTISYEEYKRGK